jgi:LAS superfamily LD-carboxypeptidase LdcB
MNEFEITGRARSHIVDLEGPHCALHYEVAASFLALRDAAAQAGIDLHPRSSFRDFQTQMTIWNSKWRGERDLWSRDGVKLDRNQLSEGELIDAILAWSALPGGSRHHWGTDIDVIDTAAVPNGYTVQLVPSEYAADGVFSKLANWLNNNLHRFGFFRPYLTDRGGVCSEPWHISYAPVSVLALEQVSLPALRRALSESELEGKNELLARLPEIYTRYMLAIDAPNYSNL